MDEQRQVDQLVPTCSSSVPIRDVTLKTCQKQWGGERESGIYVLIARRDDDFCSSSRIALASTKVDIPLKKATESNQTIVFTNVYYITFLFVFIYFLCSMEIHGQFL